MKLKIEVTEEDIKNGIKYNSFKCPVALAVTRALNDPKCNVFVDGIIYLDYTGKQLHYYDISGKIIYFITAYDHDRLVVPFEFEAEFKLLGNDND